MTPELSLRENKKRRTRAKLIDAAVDLLQRQGYEGTTVEQIAGAVNVSPRTVAHYFPSKDRLLLSILDDYQDWVAGALRRIPARVPPLQALRDANLELLDRAALEPARADRLSSVLQTIRASPPLSAQSMTMREPAVLENLAARMCTTPDDRRVDLVMALWVAILGTAWTGVAAVCRPDGAAGAPAVDVAEVPALLRTRLLETWDRFGELAPRAAP